MCKSKKSEDFLSKYECEETIKEELWTLDEQLKEIGLDVIFKYMNLDIDLGSVVSYIYDELLKKFGEYVDKDLNSANNEFVDNFREAEQGDTEGDYGNAMRAFENFYNMTVENCEKLQRLEKNKKNPYFTEVLSMYGKLVKRAHVFIKNLKNESPTSLDEVEEATRDMCEKITAYNGAVEVNQEYINEFGRQVSGYHKYATVDNGKKVIESYKKLYDEILESINIAYDNAEGRAKGFATRHLVESIPRIFGALQKEVAPVIGQVQYKNPKSFREAADMIKDVYERVIEKTGAQRDEATIKSLSDRLKEYYDDKIDSDKLLTEFYSVKELILGSIRSMSETPAEDKKEVGPVKPTRRPLPELPKHAPKSDNKPLEKKKNKNVSILQRKLETIFTNILNNHFSTDGKEDDEVKDFKVQSKVDNITKAMCPTWSNFMDLVFTKLGTNKKYATNKTLIGILLASCCAADNMKTADAVCKAVKKITKDAKIKVEGYMAEAEKIRQNIKSKIGSLKDPKGLDSVVQGALKTSLGLDNALVTIIFGQVDQARSKK